MFAISESYFSPAHTDRPLFVDWFVLTVLEDKDSIKATILTAGSFRIMSCLMQLKKCNF